MAHTSTESTHNFTAANKHHFDSIAQNTNTVPGIDIVNTRTIEQMLKLYPFNKEETSILDFACGNGELVSLLTPSAKSIVGVDISQGMVDEFNKTASKKGLPSMHAVSGDILDKSSTPKELEGQKFDVIICCLAYHHFSSPLNVSRALGSYLKEGGALLISEFIKYPMTSTGSAKDHSHIIAHTDPKVFEEDGMRAMLTEAGFKDVAFSERIQEKLYGNDCIIMVSKGIK